MNLELRTPRMLARIEDGIGWMTFNQPEKHNALSLDMCDAMADIIEAFETDEAVRAVVMSGAGGKSFISGADISEFDKTRASAEQQRTYGQASARGNQALVSMTKPLIAKVTGYCIGGGLATALHADIRFATPDSTFGIPAAKLGLGYDYEGLAKLSRICGPARARDILFSARFLTAEEAAEAGIVQFICERDRIDDEVSEYVHRVCSNAPLTIRAAKAAVNAFERGGQADEVTRVRSLVSDCFDSTDYAEGRRAFAQKRKPSFTGR